MAAPHIVLLPMPLQGHLNPFLWLADYFVSSGLSVTFVLSARLFSLLSRNPASSAFSLLTGNSNLRIEVVPDGLPVDTNVSREELFSSFTTMEEGLDQLMKKLTDETGSPSPSCIVTESMLPWTQTVADKHGIPRVEVWIGSATIYAILMVLPDLADKGSLSAKPESSTKMADIIPGMPPFPVRYLPQPHSGGDSRATLELARSFFANIRKVDRVLVYTFYDLESVVIDALRAQQIPVEPVGPFLSTNENRLLASVVPEDRDCLDWLDAQQEASVLYVAFGSIAALDKETLQEMAIGLELSQVPVLWVIRPDSVKGDLSDVLPERFQSETLKAKVHIISWAPQLKVLAHPAVGAFLTHCGWNSTIESVYMGVPMIGFPDAVDQHTNLRCIMDWKVGMELDKQEEGGARCSREAVKSVVSAMMEGEEGKEARRRARELSKAARNATQVGSSKANLDKLVKDLKNGRIVRHL